ncbi:MAG: hypothetical protein ACUVUF_07000 [Candidatus Bathycorpusculaceae bacterium]
MYAAWIKIDETLPWIEIEGMYKTRNEARKAAKEAIKRIKIKIVHAPDREPLVKTLATIKTSTGKR